MSDAPRIEDASHEVFGLAAVVHFLRQRAVDDILAALAEAGFSASRHLIEQLLPARDAELVSEIGGTDPEPLGHYFEELGELDAPTRHVLDAACRLRPGGRVLDIGCGPGRFLKVFRRRGYETLGTDHSRLMVWLCRARDLGPVRLLAIEHLGPDLGRFDIQLLLGHNLGIGGTPDGARRILAACAGLAADGGLLLVNSIDVAASGEPDASNYAAYNRRPPGRHIGQTDFRVSCGPLRSDEFPWIHVTSDEVRGWGAALGWELVEVAADPARAGHWSGVLRRVADRDSAAGQRPA